MSAKLTLRLNENVIARMKNYAAKRQLSLSKITENIFRQILESSEEENQNLTPIVQKYKGILKSDLDEKDDLLEQLIKKHS